MSTPDSLEPAETNLCIRPEPSLVAVSDISKSTCSYLAGHPVFLEAAGEPHHLLTRGGKSPSGLQAGEQVTFIRWHDVRAGAPPRTHTNNPLVSCWLTSVAIN